MWCRYHSSVGMNQSMMVLLNDLCIEFQGRCGLDSFQVNKTIKLQTQLYVHISCVKLFLLCF